MNKVNKEPEWVTRGKTIRSLIEEISNFSDLDSEVRISLDSGDSHHPISLVGRMEGKYCVLMNAEKQTAIRERERMMKKVKKPKCKAAVKARTSKK
ncbi:hypothetical protein ACFLS1_13020 [Verrucomicrobiota bacterium]